MIFAKEFIHIGSAGNNAECLAVKDKAKQLLEENFESLGLRGYFLQFVEDSDDAEEKLILSDYTTFTDGRFPFLYARVQPGESEAGIRPLMESLGFLPIQPGYLS
jgi:hypothetical protein